MSCRIAYMTDTMASLVSSNRLAARDYETTTRRAIRQLEEV